MNPQPLPTPELPPFCTAGSDGHPDGPATGTPESVALAAWELLTRARVSRSKGSGRMSLLARYRAEDTPLSTERIVWIALHPFEGAGERWSCRRALRAAMTDDELTAAIVQEMGGPAEEPDEMSTLGFWKGTVGFHFDHRGPSVHITETVPGCAGEEPRRRSRRIGKAALLRSARKLLAVDHAAGPTPPHRQATVRNGASAPASQGEQLSLL